MEDFEDRLKRVRLRRPSPSLDARVVTHDPPALRARRVVSMRSAAAAMLLMGIAGFAIGLRAGAPRGHEMPPSIAIEILSDSIRGNPFDFTVASDIVFSAAADDAVRPSDAGPGKKEM